HTAALNNLAVVLAETPDRRDEALTLVQRAIDLRGHEQQFLDTKGTILVNTGKAKDALEILEASARGVAADPRHRFHLALAYSDVGANDKAREEFQTALKRNLEKQI